MRKTLSALVLAAGLAGFGATAQAAPVSAAAPIAVQGPSDIVLAQMSPGERRMMRRRMERRAMRRADRRMERRMMRREMMRRDMRRGGYYRGY